MIYDQIIIRFIRTKYHLSASVFKGVWDTDFNALPPIFSPHSAFFNEEKSTSSSSELDSSSS